MFSPSLAAVLPALTNPQAIFSTVFFNISFNDNSADALQYSPRIRIFFAITVSLTIAVVASCGSGSTTQ